MGEHGRTAGAAVFLKSCGRGMPPSSQAARRSGHGASVSRHAPRPHHYAFFSYSKGDAGHKIPDLYEGVTAKPHLAGRIVGRLRAELTIARQLFRNRQPGTRSTRFPAQPWPPMRLPAGAATKARPEPVRRHPIKRKYGRSPLRPWRKVVLAIEGCRLFHSVADNSLSTHKRCAEVVRGVIRAIGNDDRVLA